MKSVTKFLKKSGPLLAVTAVAVIGMVDPALADDAHNLGGSINTVGTNLTNLPSLISLAGYSSGAAAIIAGALKFKGHVDNPGQNSLVAALGRLGVGALLMAIPALSAMIMATAGMHPETDAAAYKKITVDTSTFK